MSDVMFPEPMDPMDRAMQRMDKKAWAEADAEIAMLKTRLAEVTAERAALRAAMDDFIDGYYDPEGTPNLEYYAHQFESMLRPTVSASVVQYKPCEICTTQSWCETHGCQCYPVSAVQPERCCLDYPRCDCNSPPEPAQEPKGCNHFPGQVNCEWCTEVPHE